VRKQRHPASEKMKIASWAVILIGPLGGALLHKISQKLISDWPDENFAFKKVLRQLKQRLFASEKIAQKNYFSKS